MGVLCCKDESERNRWKNAIVKIKKDEKIQTVQQMMKQNELLPIAKPKMHKSKSHDQTPITPTNDALEISPISSSNSDQPIKKKKKQKNKNSKIKINNRSHTMQPILSSDVH